MSVYNFPDDTDVIPIYIIDYEDVTFNTSANMLDEYLSDEYEEFKFLCVMILNKIIIKDGKEKNSFYTFSISIMEELGRVKDSVVTKIAKQGEEKDIINLFKEFSKNLKCKKIHALHFVDGKPLSMKEQTEIARKWRSQDKKTQSL